MKQKIKNCDILMPNNVFELKTNFSSMAPILYHRRNGREFIHLCLFCHFHFLKIPLPGHRQRIDPTFLFATLQNSKKSELTTTFIQFLGCSYITL